MSETPVDVVDPDEEDIIDVDSVPADATAEWFLGVAALEAADAEEFLSEPYMAHSAEAADHFEQAAKDLEATNPEMAREAADISIRLRRFLSLDWGDPNAVVTSDMVNPPEGDVVVASGGLAKTRLPKYPIAPPLAWFQNPGLKEPTPLTITDDGHVYGHIALWGTCHTGGEQHGQCVTPPRSHTNYSHFRTGAILTSEGREVAVGHLTLDTKHANQRLNAVRASAHYDHTGHVAADVSVGEDQHGIWFSGALRPDLTDSAVRSLRSAPLSGDWRRIRGNLELVAALGVNMPGFPVPRPNGLVASGLMQSLVASGMLAPKTVVKPGTPGALSTSDLRYLKSLANRERQHAADALASEVHHIKAERDVHAFAASRKVGQ